MDVNLTIKAAARLIGTNASSLTDFEENERAYIRPAFLPKIIAFLGYNPLPEPTTFGEAVKYERLSRGWSLEGMADHTGVDPQTIRKIENDCPSRIPRPLRRLAAALGLEALR